MKSFNDLLLIGDPKLYEVSAPVQKEVHTLINIWVADLHNVMEDIRAKYGFGRAIAAPQLGIMKRLIYVNIESPMIFINPEIVYKSNDMFELWDDCMSLPNLFVKVKRHKHITVKYMDEFWNEHIVDFKDDMSELIQHENDHLNGILCTMRAIDNKSFQWRQF